MLFLVLGVIGLVSFYVGLWSVANARTDKKLGRLGRVNDSYCTCGWDPLGDLCPMCGSTRDVMGVWRKPALAQVGEVRTLSLDEIRIAVEQAQKDGEAFDARTRGMEQLTPEDLRIKVD